MPTVNKTQINQSGINFSVTPATAHQGARIDNNGENHISQERLVQEVLLIQTVFILHFHK